MPGKKNGMPTVAQVERAHYRVEIMTRRVKGESEHDIARAMGMSLNGVKCVIIKELRRLSAVSEKKAEDYRQLELLRCDYYLRQLDPGIAAADNRTPRCIEMAIKVSERRARLMGLDAEVRSLSVNLSGDLANLTPPELMARAQQLGIPISQPPLPALLPGEEPLSEEEFVIADEDLPQQLEEKKEEGEEKDEREEDVQELPVVDGDPP